MDVVALRKLALKSTLNFGKYSLLSVAQCMAEKKTRSYLRWAYFCMSKISFLDPILDDLRIPEDLRIPKPGTDKGKHEELKNRFREEFNNSTPNIDQMNEARRFNKSKINAKIRKENMPSKATLMRNNRKM